MNQILAIGFALTFATAPLEAQAQTQDNDNQFSEGFNLLQEGTRLLLEGLLQELGPALLELEGRIIDLNAYSVPEILPNGDIIIRRRVPLEVPDNGQTDL